MKKIYTTLAALFLIVSLAIVQGQDVNSQSTTSPKVDSYGNSIVNQTDGLPDWAQKDVDALRTEIGNYLQKKTEKISPDILYELDYVLGNFIGQAFARNINISEIIDLFDSEIVTKEVAWSVLDFLHYYENVKYYYLGESYKQTVYPKEVEDFVMQAGGQLQEILSIEPTNIDYSPSGAYTKTTTNTGLVNLTGYTTVWNGGVSVCDDCYEDIPIGFNFYFYEGDDDDANTQVRVSSNGYISFFQQGGGALDGTDYTNDAITSTIDPDGFAAPWWDDMIVDAQGSTDFVGYKTEGSVGSRVFTVQFYSLTRRTGDTDDYHTFQVKLYEANDEIRFNFGSWNSDIADNATVGMEDYSGIDGDCGPNCTSSNSSKPPNNYQYEPYIGTPGLWKGIHNSDWHLAVNWDNLEIPTSTTDVEIPDGTPYSPEITSSAYCHDINIHGHITLDGSSARLYVDDDIYWESGSSATVTSVTARIYVEDDWFFEAGADVQLGGYVYFDGTTSSTITVKDDNCSFNHMRNQKDNTTLSFSSTSTEPLRINGILYLDGTSTFQSYEGAEPIIHNGRISNTGGSLHLDNGTWEFTSGGTSSFAAGDYFNNLKVSAGAVVFSDDVEAENDVSITGGSFNLGSTNLSVGGVWMNTAGTGAFLESTSRVTFNGTTAQQFNWSEDFNILEIDNYRLTINSNATVTCNSYDWTSGLMFVHAGTFDADDLIDNGIAGNWDIGSFGTANLTNNSGYVHLLGDVFIDGGTMNVFGGDLDSYWPGDADASLEMNGGELIFHDQGIYIRSTGTFTDNFSNNPQISTADNLRIDRIDFSPTSGSFNLIGNTNTYIRMDDGNFPVLNIMKGSSSYTVDANTTLDVNYLNIVEGTFDANGQTTYVEYLVQIEDGGVLKMTNSADKIVTDDVDFLSGSDANITSGNIEVKGVWKFHNGTYAQLGAGNTVTFISGGSSNYIECDDADAEFGSVVIDVDTYIYGGSSQPVRIAEDCNVNTGYEFDVQSETLTVGNLLYINDGALMTLWAGSSGGTVEADYLAVFGELDVGIGNFESDGFANIFSAGELVLNGGTCYVDNYINIHGTLTMSSGLLHCGNITIESTCNDNISGGTIQVVKNFNASNSNTFQPSGGEVAFEGSTIGGEIVCNNGNYFHDFILLGTAGESELHSDIIIQNDFELNYQEFYTLDHNIQIGGNWTDNAVGSGFNEGTGTVSFFGSDQSIISNINEGFYNVIIDKTSGAYNAIEIPADKSLIVLNDLDIQDGCIEMNNNSIIHVNNDLTIASDAGLNAVSDNNLNIYVGGTWNNDNTSYSTTYGFNPGTSSTVTFDGSATSYLYTDCSQEDFYHIVVDKGVGSHLGLQDNLHISGDYLGSSGGIVNTSANLSHEFWGDITVESNGFINLGSGTYTHNTLKGTSEQVLSSPDGSNLYLGNLVIDKDYPTSIVRVINDGFFLNNLDVNVGTMNLYGDTHLIFDDIIVNNGGKLDLGAGGTILTDGAIMVFSGGYFEAVGISGNEALITRQDELGFSLNVSSGGTIAAQHTNFEFLTNNGININNGATVDPAYTFNNCTFSGSWEGITTLLTINNSQNLTIDGAEFDDYGVATINVAKTLNQGNVLFTNATGLFAGPNYENDTHNRIDWDGFVAGTWTGIVSDDWNNPANWQYSMKPTDEDDATIPAGTTNNPRIYNAPAFCKNISIAEGASLHVDDETLTVDGILEIYGELIMDNAAGVLVINDDIVWKSGSTDDITNGTINAHSEWIFENGTNAKLGTANTVFFKSGDGLHPIECNDADAEFGSVVIDVFTFIHGGSIEPVRISGNCTVNSGYEFTIQYKDLIVEGILDIKDGALMTLWGGASGGSLINNSGFELYGELDIGIGTATINAEFDIEATGILSISSGTLIQSTYAPGVGTNIDGELNITGNGIFKTASSFVIGNGSDINISDGVIQVDIYFIANDPGVFQPLGGTVEFTGNVWSEIHCFEGNYFHNLKINKIDHPDAFAYIYQDIEVKNDLLIESGEFKCSHSTAPWYNILIAGNWTNNVGDSGFEEGEGTVTFNGSNPSDITTDETFYNLAIDKTYSVNDGVEIMTNQTINIINDLTITDGCIEMNDNSTLNVDNTIYIALDAGLNAASDNNLNIYVGRHWSNSNTSYSTTHGFNPGTSSTVTFDGPGGPNSIITNSLQQDFYNLIVDKPSGFISLFSGIQILGDFILDGGDVYNQDPNLQHIFWGDITVNTGDLELHQLNGSTTLKGTGDQTLSSYAYDQMHFYQLIVDKTDAKKGGPKAQSVNITGDGVSFYNLTVDEGTINLNGNTHNSESTITVNDGGEIAIGPGAIFYAGNLVVNNGGALEVIGVSGNEAVLYTVNACNIESGAIIAAEYAHFEHLNGDGINIKSGAIVNSTYSFDNCTFSGDGSNGTLLTFNNNQNFTVDGAVFPENTWGGTYNVAKTDDQGSVSFTNTTGLFAGPDYENDTYNRIDWSDFATGLWTGAVSNEWNNPANWQNSLKPGAANDVTIPSGTLNDPWVTADDQECDELTIAAGATLTVTGKTLTANGILDIEDGATMTLYNGITAGTLINNSPFSLEGELDVGIGSATINHNFFVQSTGVLSITDGSFVQPIGSTTNRIYGEFNLTGDGIFHPYKYIIFESGSDINVTNGLIQIEIDIRFLGSNTFQPTGGAIEIVGSFNNSIIVCDKSSGNYLNNLVINKTAGTSVKITEDTEIRGNLDIDSGIFGIDISNDLDIDGDWTNNVGNAGTNIGFGKVTFTGSGNQTLTTVDTYENFPRLGINKSAGELTLFSDVQVSSDDMLQINAGELNLNGQSLTHAGDLEINNDGVLLLDGSSELSIADGKNLRINNGGTFAAIGVSGDEALITNISGNYSFDVESGGTIEAYYAIFEGVTANGVNVKSGAIIDGTNDFDNCIFRNGESGGTLLTINNNQTLQIEGAQFPANIWSGTYNVAKSDDQGQLTFSNYSGAFSGSTYENDPNNRIDWDAPGFDLDVTVFLEGPFNGSLMESDINSMLPLTHPYNNPPWNYSGTENVGSIPNSNIVDWVLIELRDAADGASALPGTVIDRQAAFLLNDGSVVGLDGSSFLSFNQSVSQSLFVVIWHRNHLGIMSANGVMETSDVYTYDFTNGETKVYGGNSGHKQLISGTWGMIGGNADGNDIIENNDKVIWQSNVGNKGYLNSDMNIDMQINNIDKNDIWYFNTGKESQVPD